MVQRVPIHPAPCPLLTSYVSKVHWWQFINIDMLLLMKVRTRFRFPSFLPNALSLSQDPIQDTTCHLVILSPQSPLGCDSFSDFLWFQWPWQFWGVLVGYSTERPSIRICLMFFSWLDLGYVFGAWRPQRRSVIFITSRQGSCYQHDITCHCDTWLRLCLLNFSPVVTFPPLHTVLFGRKSLGTAHT